MNRALRAGITAAATLALASTATLTHGGPGPTTDAMEIRFGAFFPEGDDDLWETNEEVFTLEMSDFDDFILGLSWVHSFTNTVEFGVNLDFYDTTVLSQYSDWLDQDGFPIFHDTDLYVVPFTLDVRILPAGRHRVRAQGRHVLKPVFYVGGGVGAVYWEYEEVGDFLDFTVDPPEIFPNRFKDEGTALEFHALAGVELPLSRATSLLFEGRYSWADDELGGDFAGLGTIDLGGPAAFCGFSFRF